MNFSVKEKTGSDLELCGISPFVIIECTLVTGAGLHVSKALF